MNSIKALHILCDKCLSHLSISWKACPFRNSNDHCVEFKEIEEDLKLLERKNNEIKDIAKTINDGVDLILSPITFSEEEERIFQDLLKQNKRKKEK